jgi:hypothetical protein
MEPKTNMTGGWRFACASILFLALCAAPADAQAAFDPIDDLLRWFPLGTYDAIVHEDYEDLEVAETLPLYRAFFAPYENDFNIRFTLPFPLDQNIRSRTMAQVLEIAVSSFESDREARDFVPLRGDRIASETIGGKQYFFESVGARLYVYRYFFLDDAVAAAERRGSLERTGLALLERPVYFARHTIDGKSVLFFAYATLRQELLVAPSYTLLERMVRAGLGTSLQLLDGRDYRDLLYMDEYLGQIWRLRSVRALYRVMLRTMRSQGAEQSKITALERIMEEEANFTVESRVLGPLLSFNTIHQFSSFDSAEQFREQASLYQNVDILTADLLRRNLLLFFKRRDFQRLGYTVVSTLTYDDIDVRNLWREYQREMEQAPAEEEP